MKKNPNNIKIFKATKKILGQSPNVNDLTLDEFNNLPTLSTAEIEKIKVITSLVILPSKHTHDSNYRIMSFVPTEYGIPIGKIVGCSDVIHFEGIGGIGTFVPNAKSLVGFKREYKDRYPPYSIDCLKESGLIQIFCPGHFLKIDPMALSSFAIYSKKQNEK